MTTPNLAERWRLLQLTRRHGRPRSAPRRRFGWSAARAPIEEFLFVPSDLRSCDPSLADELHGGRFNLAGESIAFATLSPFLMRNTTAAWQEQLHGFGWLRDLAAAGLPDDVALARRLTGEWLAHCNRPTGPAWQPHVLAPRIIAWLSHAGLLLEASEPQFFRAVTESLGAQLRVLAATGHLANPGVPRLQSYAALLLADLAIAGRDRSLERTEQQVLAEIGRQVLPDGGHVSRNATAVIELLLDLLPLRRCYMARDVEPPAALSEAIARMLRFVRAMRLGDGSLARFNGVGATPVDALATVLAFDTDALEPPTEMPASGYVRLQHGQTVLLMDCGAAPAFELAGTAQAGCLAFEMSVGAQALLVNAGYPDAGRRRERPIARATASHNTLTVNAQSSARFVSSPAIVRLCGDAALAGPGSVSFRFMKHNGEQAFEATHDGYAQTSQLIHTRRLEMSADGTRLEGRDRLGPRTGVLRLGRDVPFALHFHLAPGIEPSLETVDGRSCVTLAVPGQASWLFAAGGAELLIETSQRFDTAATAAPARQIVLRGTCPGETSVSWLIEQLPA